MNPLNGARPVPAANITIGLIGSSSRIIEVNTENDFQTRIGSDPLYVPGNLNNDGLTNILI